ncbi:hypothetical protein EGT07_12910 [Herbaspirillum sp. HC18]|nr:hypothetical protein EGT07_12910 [Herbaspirillum sp. HC18]
MKRSAHRLRNCPTRIFARLPKSARRWGDCIKRKLPRRYGRNLYKPAVKMGRQFARAGCTGEAVMPPPRLPPALPCGSHSRPRCWDSAATAGRPPNRLRVSPAQDNWSPAARAVALVGGGVLGVYGVIRRNPVGVALAAAGAALEARSISNMPLARMAGVASGRSPINVNKTTHIAASPEQVFDTWSRFENFPQVMSHVQEVRDPGDGRSHWLVKGPAGALMEWNSQIVESRLGDLALKQRGAMG